MYKSEQQLIWEAYAADAEEIYTQQLEMGIKVEMEHTDDPEVARQIATDHLAEDPEYYTKLTKAGL